MKALVAKLGISRAEGYRRRNTDPDFPPAIPMGPGIVAYEDGDGDRYIEILKARAQHKQEA